MVRVIGLVNVRPRAGIMVIAIIRAGIMMIAIMRAGIIGIVIAIVIRAELVMRVFASGRATRESTG